MTNAWRIQQLAPDTYRFFNISCVGADGITLGSTGEDDDERSIEIAGPVDHLLGPSTSPYYFDHPAAPGDYVLQWHASAAARRTDTFRLPPAANTTLLLAEFVEESVGS
jgi:hypothetical protein